MKTRRHKVRTLSLIGILIIAITVPAPSGASNVRHDNTSAKRKQILDLEARGPRPEPGRMLDALRGSKTARQILPADSGRTFSSTQQLFVTDSEVHDELGYSVAISGDTAVVGAPFDAIGSNIDQGSVYVFVREGFLWSLQAKITASDGTAGDFFGLSVAISDNTVVIGAPLDTIGPNASQGSVYIFARTGGGTTWTQQAKLNAPDGAGGDRLGFDVGISGLTVVASAPLDDNASVSDQGSAYVFVRGIATGFWSFQAKLTFVDGAEDDQFGYSVAISGSTVIVGVPFDDIGPNNLQGSACVFVRSGTSWSQQARIIANDALPEDVLGFDVGISGNTAIAGAPGDEDRPGAAYIFVRNGTTWTQQKKLVGADTQPTDSFGRTVAIAPEEALVGAFRNGDDGAGYVFTRSGTTWVQKAKLTADPAISGSTLGQSVALSPGIAILGSPSFATGRGVAIVFVSTTPFDFDGDGRSDLGVFRPGPAEWWIDRSSTGTAVTAQFGASTDRIVPRDYTGDGKADIAVWRPTSGEWFVLRSEDSSFFSFPFGTSGDIPAPFDISGLATASPTVFRPSTGTWFVQLGNQTGFFQFGISGDIPVPADYDGDGREDIAIYRPSNGQWWLRRSTLGLIATTFGSSTDKPVPGDYTGDGKADVAFFRPSTGEWFILRSENGTFFAFPFGTTGDIPSPGDYDGDGRYDATVFRPSTGTWFSQRSTAGILIQQFGLNGDRPVASAFVP